MLKDKALKAAKSGLDFFVRKQILNIDSADFGRMPLVYDCNTDETLLLTANWTCGVACEALLTGYKFLGEERYFEAAKNSVEYMKSLQQASPFEKRCIGVFHEQTPQTPMAHPRDALTAAWAVLDYSKVANDQECFKRAKLYADWFCEVGMEKGFPYWTVRFDDKELEPFWTGSFHSGSAFFMYRMYSETADEKYRNAMKDILDYYNTYHLSEDGSVKIIVDRDTKECLDGKADKAHTNLGWEMMHRYNDDFGALANLAAWKIEQDDKYKDAALAFLDNMVRSQRDNGGFGPTEWADAIPSAGGVVVQEMLAAKELGIGKIEYEEAVEQAVKYLLSIQLCDKNSENDGAFLGMNEQFQATRNEFNIRTAAYAIMALFRYAGAKDFIYYFE